MNRLGTIMNLGKFEVSWRSASNSRKYNNSKFDIFLKEMFGRRAACARLSHFLVKNVNFKLLYFFQLAVELELQETAQFCYNNIISDQFYCLHVTTQPLFVA